MMPASGELSGPVTADTIRPLVEEIDQKRWSGTLSIDLVDGHGSREEVFLLFLQGRLVTSHKKRNPENFPQELVQHDVLSVSRLQDLLQKMRREDKRLEYLLVQEGLLNAEQLPKVLSKILLSRLAFLSRSFKGTFEFQTQSGDALDLAVSELALPNDDLFFKEGLSYKQIFGRSLPQVDTQAKKVDEGELTFEDYLLKFPVAAETKPALPEPEKNDSAVIESTPSSSAEGTPIHVPIIEIEPMEANTADLVVDTDVSDETALDLRIMPEGEETLEISIDVSEDEIVATLGGEDGANDFIDIAVDLGFDRQAARQMGEDEMAFLSTMIQELNVPDSDITLLILRYASSVFDRGVLFRIDDSRLRSIGGFGLERDEDQRALNLGGLEISLDMNTLFAQPVSEKKIFRGDVPSLSVDQAFFSVLGGAPKEAFVAPIASAQTTISVFYGDFGQGSPLKKGLVGFEIFLNQIGLELEKKFLRERLEELQGRYT